MDYKELKEGIEKLKSNDSLLNDIKLDEATTVRNGAKFVESHFYMIDEAVRDRAKKKKVNNSLIMPYFNRLLKYYNEIKKKTK